VATAGRERLLHGSHFSIASDRSWLTAVDDVPSDLPPNPGSARLRSGAGTGHRGEFADTEDAVVDQRNDKPTRPVRLSRTPNIPIRGA
jgi:hypothetical protein